MIEFPGQVANEVATLTFDRVRGQDSDFRPLEKRIRLCLSLLVCHSCGRVLRGEAIRGCRCLHQRCVPRCCVGEDGNNVENKLYFIVLDIFLGCLHRQNCREFKSTGNLNGVHCTYNDSPVHCCLLTQSRETC